VRILPYGDRGLLAEYDDLDSAAAAARRLAADPPPGVLELVPAARTVLLRVASGTPLRLIERRLAELGDPDPATDAPHGAAPLVRIPVRYDGVDLSDAAAALGLSTAELIRRHTAVEWRCAFMGFAPGFGYLVAPDFGPTPPRRATSRPRVPAGSVALAAGYCGVYPRESPGGWHLLGTTDVPLWDLDREPPALLQPGVRVRFEAVP
jgi:KipI family sensor histidine kinase inhibitor